MLALIVAEPAAAKNCPDFTVGEANSSSYPDGKLPAKKVSAKHVKCKRVRALARAFHKGDVKIPDDARGYGEWGDRFEIKYGGLKWRCRLWWIGGSGPSYKFRCSYNSRSARWSVG